MGIVKLTYTDNAGNEYEASFTQSHQPSTVIFNLPGPDSLAIERPGHGTPINWRHVAPADGDVRVDHAEVELLHLEGYRVRIVQWAKDYVAVQAKVVGSSYFGIGIFFSNERLDEAKDYAVRVALNVAANRYPYPGVVSH